MRKIIYKLNLQITHYILTVKVISNSTLLPVYYWTAFQIILDDYPFFCFPFTLHIYLFVPT